MLANIGRYDDVERELRYTGIHVESHSTCRRCGTPFDHVSKRLPPETVAGRCLADTNGVIEKIVGRTAAGSAGPIPVCARRDPESEEAGRIGGEREGDHLCDPARRSRKGARHEIGVSQLVGERDVEAHRTATRRERPHRRAEEVRRRQPDLVLAHQRERWSDTSGLGRRCDRRRWRNGDTSGLDVYEEPNRRSQEFRHGPRLRTSRLMLGYAARGDEQRQYARERCKGVTEPATVGRAWPIGTSCDDRTHGASRQWFSVLVRRVAPAPPHPGRGTAP